MESKSESEVAGDPCGACSTIPDSIVVLACDHKLCFACTLSVADERVIACPLCAKTTALTPELLAALGEAAQGRTSLVHSAVETSVMDAGRALRSVPRCTAHTEEQIVYFDPTNRRLLCAQCASGGARLWDELWPLQRCLPQTLECLSQSFREAEFAARRLALRRAELELQSHALRIGAASQSQRLEDALSAIIETAEQLKAALRDETANCLENGLTRVAERCAALQSEENRLSDLAAEFWRLRSEDNAGDVLAFAAATGAELASREECEEGALVDEISTQISVLISGATQSAYEKLAERVPRILGAPSASGTNRVATAETRFWPSGQPLQASEATWRAQRPLGSPPSPLSGYTPSRAAPSAPPKSALKTSVAPLRFSFVRSTAKAAANRPIGEVSISDLIAGNQTTR